MEINPAYIWFSYLLFFICKLICFSFIYCVLLLRSTWSFLFKGTTCSIIICYFAAFFSTCVCLLLFGSSPTNHLFTFCLLIYFFVWCLIIFFFPSKYAVKSMLPLYKWNTKQIIYTLTIAWRMDFSASASYCSVSSLLFLFV